MDYWLELYSQFLIPYFFYYSSGQDFNWYNLCSHFFRLGDSELKECNGSFSFVNLTGLELLA